jgi:predicted SAM-dependent methyltransferase
MTHLTLRKSYYKYFEGIGLDIGPFDKPFVESEYPYAVVKYVDKYSPETLRLLFPEIVNLKPIPADFEWDISENGLGFDNNSYNFIILSHVLEHIANPFLFLKQSYDKLIDGGVLYLAVPDGRFSDDQGRKLTQYEDLECNFEKRITTITDLQVVDYLHSKTIREVGWVKEWIASGQAFTPAILEQEIKRSFHVSVWSTETFFNHISKFLSKFNLSFSLIAIDTYEHNGYENILVLRKSKNSSSGRLEVDLEEEFQQLSK